MAFEKGQSSNNAFRKKDNIDGFVKVQRQQRYPQWHPFTSRMTTIRFYSFNGYCNLCNYFGHKATNCRDLPRRNITFDSQNSFDSLKDYNIICFNCQNVGHIARNCHMNFAKIKRAENRFSRKKQRKYGGKKKRSQKSPRPWLLILLLIRICG